MQAVIRLLAPDGNLFVVPEKIVSLFPTIGPMINKEREVWITEVNGLILPQIIQWAIHHLDKPTADPHQIKLELDEWDIQFVKQQHPYNLMELILAGHFLGSKYLRDLAALALADVIKGNTPEQNEYIFGSRANELLENIIKGVVGIHQT